jgi:outer membrane immunogenic protein
MKSLFGKAGVAIVALLIGAPAFAADMAVKAAVEAAPSAATPSYTWTGWHVGVTAGYGFGNADPSLTFNNAESTVVDSFFAPAPSTLHSQGFIGGGEIGYDYQSGSYLLGLETDLSYADVRATGSATGPFFIGGQFNTTVTSRLDWLGTVRGRLGVLPTSNLLLYGTGGFAYGGLKITTIGTNVAAAPPCNGVGLAVYCASGATSSVAVGWTVGGGLQYAIAPQWLVKAEYLYVDLGKQSATYPDLDVAGGLVTSTTTFRLNVVRGGLDYRF